jgi:hypothetical protein
VLVLGSWLGLSLPAAWTKIPVAACFLWLMGSGVQNWSGSTIAGTDLDSYVYTHTLR